MIARRYYPDAAVVTALCSILVKVASFCTLELDCFAYLAAASKLHRSAITVCLDPGVLAASSSTRYGIVYSGGSL